MRAIPLFLAGSILGFSWPCLALAESTANPPEKQLTATPEVYTPGLGEFMSTIQMRHAKLWFAGKAKNWELAAYELGELKEAFEDAAKYQPVFKGKPIAGMIETIIAQPLSNLEKAIDAKDSIRYARSFDALSKACSSCHQEAGYGFISIQRPTFPPLTNQRFEPLHNPGE